MMIYLDDKGLYNGMARRQGVVWVPWLEYKGLYDDMTRRQGVV